VEGSTENRTIAENSSYDKITADGDTILVIGPELEYASIPASSKPLRRFSKQCLGLTIRKDNALV
jgi:hypothetical protein